MDGFLGSVFAPWVMVVVIHSYMVGVVSTLFRGAFKGVFLWLFGKKLLFLVGQIASFWDTNLH